jgi:hypothetical protein
MKASTLRRSAGAALATLLVALPATASAADHTVACRGSADRCTATFPLHGAHTGDRVVVQLTDTDLALRSIVPSSRSLRARYGFAGFSMRLGGSEFLARLIVDGKVPAGAAIRFTFAVPPAMRSCGGYHFPIDGSVIRLGDLQVRGLSCGGGRRVARRCVSGMSPGRGWTVFQVDDTVTLRRHAQRLSFDLRNVRASCAPSG